MILSSCLKVVGQFSAKTTTVWCREDFSLGTYISSKVAENSEDDEIFGENDISSMSFRPLSERFEHIGGIYSILFGGLKFAKDYEKCVLHIFWYSDQSEFTVLSLDLPSAAIIDLFNRFHTLFKSQSLVCLTRE